MSNTVYGAVPAGHKSCYASFIAADTTIGKVLVEPQPAALPVDTDPPSPLYYGGASLYELSGFSSDSAAKDVQLHVGDVLTTVGTATGTGTTTTGTIVRATGSFIADGWRVGRLAMIFAAANAAPQAGVEGILLQVTGVTATTLTLNGTPLSALTLDAGARIVAVSPWFATSIPAGSGNSSTAAEKWILSSSNSAAERVLDRKLGPTQMVIAAMDAAVSALPANVSLAGAFARF